MNDQRRGMLSIGAFARASLLSLKALRLYDQLGLLKPSYVDPDSGYRYYAADQLRVARLILLMRQMDMPLATIRRVLAAAPAEAEPLVRTYWQTQEERMAQARRMVHVLVAQLRMEGSIMALDVEVKTVDPQPIISLTQRVKVDQLDLFIRDSVERLTAQAQQAASGVPFGIYHGPINHDDDGPLEVCLPVQGTVATSDGVQARALPGGTVASVMMQGEQCQFPAVLQGYDAVYDWVREHGYTASEAPREIWHDGPEHMEIALPFREAA